MPYETFVVETGKDILSGDRKHDAVAKDISEVFERIRERGGRYITTIPLADETSPTSSGGHPNGALYIVADMPESAD